MYFVHQESFHLKRKILQQIVTKIYYIDRSYLGKSIRKNSLPRSSELETTVCSVRERFLCRAMTERFTERRS